MKLGIVCGYGVVDSSIRTNIEMIGLSEYYTSVNAYIFDHLDDFDCVVICGGYTNSLANKSESQSVLFDIPDSKQIIETTSQSSLESIVLAVLTARTKLPMINEIVIFCDKAREAYTNEVVHELFGGIIKTTVIAYDRQDIHPHSTKEYQSSVSLPDFFSSIEFINWKKVLHTVMSKSI